MTSAVRTLAVGRDGTRSRVDSAYRGVKQAIIRCELEPGQQITEAQMATRYGTSRGTMHASLGRLAHEGLVRVLPREGYVVAPITLRSVRDLHTARRALEPFAARLAAGRVDAGALLGLAERTRRPQPPLVAAALEQAIAANREFHLAIVRATGSERLTHLVGIMLDEAERLAYFAYLHSPSTQDEYPPHLAVVEALADGDAELAERRMLAHIDRSEQWTFESLVQSPSIQTVGLSLA